MALVTLTRCIGCGGLEVAKSAARELGVDVYDDDRLEEEAAKLGLGTEEVRELDERAPGLLDSLFSQKPKAYLDLLEAVVYEIAKRGEGVIVGHGSQILLRDFGCALHVRVHASEQFRVEHMMTQYGLKEEEARKMIRKRDRQQRGFMEFAFHKDLEDPSLYDLVLNRDKMSTDLAAKLIVEAARAPEIKECNLVAAETMGRLELLKLVEAALLKSGFNLSTIHIEVPRKGLVHVTAWTETKDQKARLLQTVKRVQGVSEVRLDVGVMPVHS